MLEDSSRGVKPRIIIYGGKMHNDSSSVTKRYGLSFSDVSLREEFSCFEGISYGAVDIVNFDTDGDNFYDSFLQRNISPAVKSSDVGPALRNSPDVRLADHLLVFSRTN
jgi:hypothetical protein